MLTVQVVGPRAPLFPRAAHAQTMALFYWMALLPCPLPWLPLGDTDVPFREGEGQGHSHLELLWEFGELGVYSSI